MPTHSLAPNAFVPVSKRWYILLATHLPRASYYKHTFQPALLSFWELLYLGSLVLSTLIPGLNKNWSANQSGQKERSENFRCRIRPSEVHLLISALFLNLHPIPLILLLSLSFSFLFFRFFVLISHLSFFISFLGGNLILKQRFPLEFVCPPQRHKTVSLFSSLCFSVFGRDFPFPILSISVTRLGDLLDFGQPFKAFGNN